MKRFLFTVIFALVACVNQANLAAARWARDELYCWHKDNMGQWKHHGLAHECPIDAPVGGPSAVIE